MPDLFEQMFNEPEDPMEREEFYPGSKRKRRPEPEPQDINGEPWRENYTVKVVRGQEQRFYAIGALAEALNTPVETLRHWIKTGRIPQAPYRGAATMVIQGTKQPGRRLYTEPMIDAAVEAFSKRGLIDSARIEWKRHADLTMEIHDAWTRIHHQETRNN